MGVTDKRIRIISAQEVGEYVVCPEAWRLKLSSSALPKDLKENNNSHQISQSRRKNWAEAQELSAQLRHYSRVICTLLALLTLVALALEKSGKFTAHYSIRKVSDTIAVVPNEILILLLITGIAVLIWDIIERRVNGLRKSAGFRRKTEILGIRGSSALPARDYSSEELGLSGRPDALLKEGQYHIPVMVHPMSDKIRDRHIIQLLVNLRLVEEEQGVRPPVGILIMGPEQRPVRVKNTTQKQQWLEAIRKEMYSILQGIPAVPAPQFYKCRNCDVRANCKHSAYKAKKKSRKDALEIIPETAESR